ncbi:hypothetical protein DQ384_01425 [Sphaerisporangium album]|uniref:Transposase DDE domain-containing protein n=1 Tax=Sphaerisporangium album TaxID=509200 RepID=A0A367FRW6_9ACTN|nr:hypothetical protein DQ384_01425 [Sphaerisporangium album]
MCGPLWKPSRLQRPAGWNRFWRRRTGRIGIGGLRKVQLEHVISATALNLTRLDAWWNGHPLNRTGTSTRPSLSEPS